MDSTEKKIERMVRAGGEGKVWFPSDFFECGSEKAVSKALQRLVADEGNSAGNQGLTGKTRKKHMKREFCCMINATEFSDL